MEKKIIQIFKKIFGSKYKFDRNSNIKDIKEMDSLKIISVQLAIQKKTFINIPIFEFEKFIKLSDIISYIEKKQR